VGGKKKGERKGKDAGVFRDDIGKRLGHVWAKKGRRLSPIPREEKKKAGRKNNCLAMNIA